MVGDAADDDEIGASIQGKENRRKEAAKGHGGKGGREGGTEGGRLDKQKVSRLVGWLVEGAAGGVDAAHRTERMCAREGRVTEMFVAKPGSFNLM